MNDLPSKARFELQTPGCSRRIDCDLFYDAARKTERTLRSPSRSRAHLPGVRQGSLDPSRRNNCTGDSPNGATMLRHDSVGRVKRQIAIGISHTTRLGGMLRTDNVEVMNVPI